MSNETVFVKILHKEYQVACKPNEREELQRAVNEVNEGFSQAEQVRAFEILDVELTEASGHLTPSLKIKRNRVMEDFAAQVGRIYQG